MKSEVRRNASRIVSSYSVWGVLVWMMGENALKGMHASSNQITQKCRRLGTKRRLVTWAEIFAEQIFQDWISAWSAPENKISGMFVSLDPCH